MDIIKKCFECQEIFKADNYEIKRGGGKFCSRKCSNKNKQNKLICNCTNCNNFFERTLFEIKKSKNLFCCHSCAATYNNKHKTKGNRRSKLEKWLEEKLIIEFPNLLIKFNSKEEINSELDIYIPSLKIAFELNGIFHYEPIFGKEKLTSIQNNDNRKFQACLENNIEICIIDTSQQKYFKENTSLKYLNIIKNIINKKLLIS